MNALKKFLLEEDAATAVEYAVMVAMILLVCIVAIASFGAQTNTMYENIESELLAH
ncbi:Flp/Fap pilin component [Polystyrenella longa]|uniref:Flp/Fap pilin component n=1 Tax=Polystyrenella longa TaxID=2528007 RepID=A0A518CPY7_9PLAN|nr:Flp family type IVb pilin [Polystyrenella longa]QDU81279.1 Flp/Fap pilin component [Polystyrenella longa]